MRSASARRRLLCFRWREQTISTSIDQSRNRQITLIAAGQVQAKIPAAHGRDGARRISPPCADAYPAMRRLCEGAVSLRRPADCSTAHPAEADADFWQAPPSTALPTTPRGTPDALRTQCLSRRGCRQAQHPLILDVYRTPICRMRSCAAHLRISAQATWSCRCRSGL